MKRDLKIPKVTFRIRVGDEVETDGGCAIGGQWLNKTTDDYFLGKRVVLFSLPGAFTPTCSSLQLPSFEKEYDFLVVTINLFPGAFNLLKKGTLALTSFSRSPAVSDRAAAFGSKFTKAESKNISSLTGLREKSALLKLGRLLDLGAPRSLPVFSKAQA